MRAEKKSCECLKWDTTTINLGFIVCNFESLLFVHHLSIACESLSQEKKIVYEVINFDPFRFVSESFNHRLMWFFYEILIRFSAKSDEYEEKSGSSREKSLLRERKTKI
jgi:hypothetical protein